MSKVKKALVVDDSAFMRKLITDMLNSHPEIEVVGFARNGKDALEKVVALQPDVITLDVEMPIMNGLEALLEIMEKHPTPVVMLSSTTKLGAENTMLAMEYGAVDFIAKPGGAISLNLHEVQDEIIKKVVSASDVQISKLNNLRAPVAKRIVPLEKPIAPLEKKVEQVASVTPAKRATQVSKVIGKGMPKRGKTFLLIGTSTGGPRALQKVLTQLPGNLPAPILIVQHMPAGFTKSLADRLDGLCEINVREAVDGEPLLDGTAYIAPGGTHLKIQQKGATYCAKIDALESPRFGHRPSVDVLFESAAEFTNLNFLTVVMTGMGHDGRDGLKQLKDSCYVATIAESIETSVVYGMPKAVVEAGLADFVVDLPKIAQVIMENLKS